ncbi:hypothetical protein HYX70_02245 [Candidatus Saccharibacteria bacterium]|nr:hypothetical protein [Candidatus Saccharibacteria bacterium]
MILFGWRTERIDKAGMWLHTKPGVGRVEENYNGTGCYPISATGGPLLPPGEKLTGAFALLRAKHMVETNVNQFYG